MEWHCFTHKPQRGHVNERILRSVLNITEVTPMAEAPQLIQRDNQDSS